MIYYHGTTRRFKHFNLEYAFHGSYLGPAVYLTDSREDAESFYASFNSPDLVNRVAWARDDYTQEGMSYDKAMEKARRENIGKDCRLLTCNVTVENVAYMSKGTGRKTYLDMYKFDPEDEDNVEFTDEYNALNMVFSKHTGLEFCNEMLPEFTVDELRDFVNSKFDSDESTTVFVEMLQELKFDAVLMQNVAEFFSMYRYGSGTGIGPLSEVANHLIVFDPSKVKIVKRETVH